MKPAFFLSLTVRPNVIVCAQEMKERGNVEVRYAHEWPDATHKRIETAGHSFFYISTALALFPGSTTKEKETKKR